MSTVSCHRFIAAFAVFLFVHGGHQRHVNADEEYSAVTTLAEAIEVCQEELRQDDKSAFVGLLTEESMRDAIHTAIRSYEELLDSRGQEQDGEQKAYFNDVVKPIYVQIATDGVWHEDCRFHNLYGLTDKRGISYDGLLLRLQIETPTAQFQGFSLPIVDVLYGRVSGD